MPVVNLSVATSESWRDKSSGERKEKTEWHRVVIFNKNLAEVAEKYLRKGAKVYRRGRAADPQMDRQGRPGEILHRSGAAEFPRRADHARCQGRGRRWRSRGSFGGAGDAPASFERDEMDDEIPF